MCAAGVVAVKGHFTAEGTFQRSLQQWEKSELHRHYEWVYFNHKQFFFAEPNQIVLYPEAKKRVREEDMSKAKVN